MAYVTIIDACLDGNHDQCAGIENTPPQSPKFIAGGGHCICLCHGPVKQEWYETVKTSAIEARERKGYTVDGSVANDPAANKFRQKADRNERSPREERH